MSRRSVAGAVLLVAAALGTGALWRGRTVEVERTVEAAPAQLDGEAVFRNRGCAGCHGSEGPGGAAPRLEDVARWAGERRPGMSAEEYVVESIRDPQAFVSPAFRAVPGGSLQAMPDLDVTEEEIDALVAYLLED